LFGDAQAPLLAEGFDVDPMLQDWSSNELGHK